MSKIPFEEHRLPGAYGLPKELHQEILKFRETALDYLRDLPQPETLRGKEVRREVYTQGSIYHVLHFSQEKRVRRDYTHEGIKMLIEQENEKGKDEALEDAA